MVTPVLEAIKAGCGVAATGGQGAQDHAALRRDTLSDGGANDSSGDSGGNRNLASSGSCN